MRYLSKAEKERQRLQSERQRWIRLVEAINFITSKKSCDQREAVDDLFAAIADNNVKARLGNWSSDPDSLDGFNLASPYDFQGEIKVCLDPPGYVRLDSQAAKIKYPIGDINGYAKVEIVAGPVVNIDFDPQKDGPIPDVNTSDYSPLLVSRDDFQKWPFAAEKEPRTAHGMPPGSGSYEKSDAPLVAEMHKLIESGEANSPTNAAWQLVKEAAGKNTTDESKVARLVRHYKDLHLSKRK
jgi:hypothetical protein